MRSLLKILQRYSNFLVFITLEVAAFILIARNNALPRSSFFSTANSIVAWQNEQISEIKGYFHLRSQNEQLAQENVALRNELSLLTASLTGDSIHYKSAKVVQLTTNRLHNYITINVGSNDSVVQGQGVRNAQGAIGVVRTVGKNYSIVLPLIHTQSKLSCRFAKNGYIGTLEWDGKDSRYAQLKDVASHIDVQPGDTIVTSGLGTVFPEGVEVGIVDKSSIQKGDSYHTIRVRLQVDFKQLRYVEVVQNPHQQQIEQLQHGLD